MNETTISIDPLEGVSNNKASGITLTIDWL